MYFQQEVSGGVLFAFIAFASMAAGESISQNISRTYYSGSGNFNKSFFNF